MRSPARLALAKERSRVDGAVCERRYVRAILARLRIFKPSHAGTRHLVAGPSLEKSLRSRVVEYATSRIAIVRMRADAQAQFRDQLDRPATQRYARESRRQRILHRRPPVVTLRKS